MHRTLLSLVAAAVLFVLPMFAGATEPQQSHYAIVVSKATQGDPAWQLVVDTLKETHQATVMTYDANPKQVLPELQRLFPKYTCFVARPDESGREFVANVHQMTRALDDDPYCDTFWGILTGYDAANALRIATTTEPLVIRKVASGTEVALDRCEEGVWYCELRQGHMVRKRAGQRPEEATAPADTTKALVDVLNDGNPDLFVTSGHATERDWQIGFRYRNGSFRCENGRLFGLDTSGSRYPVNSDNAKVFMPIGNCLMGHIDSRDAMALAYMNSAGVTQMLGYTVPTWFGYAGWGCLDYFVEQPGRYTFVEAFFANQHALVHRLSTLDKSSRDAEGLAFDRDVVAIYGDPAWEARLADGPCNWEQSLTQVGNVYTLTITPRAGEETFRPVNMNGSQRGSRPIVAYLPQRIVRPQMVEGDELQPLVTDDFVLVPLPQGDVKESYRIVFRGSALQVE